MEKLEKQQLNNLVVTYQQTGSSETFSAIYEEVSKSWRNLSTVAKSVMASEDEVISLYDDTLVNCIGKYDGRGDFINFLSRSIKFARRDLYVHKKWRYGNEYTDKHEDELARLAVAEDFTQNKEADQRQLIDFLVSGADETTTAIVEAFLQHPNPTPTAIGKELGLHHSIVIRKLKRLAGKFDTKQFGSHRDYLVAL